MRSIVLFYSLPEKTSALLDLSYIWTVSGEGPINNLSFVSSSASVYLMEWLWLSASVIGREDLAIDELVESARKQLVSWFGESCKNGKIFIIIESSKPCQLFNFRWTWK